MRPSQAMGLFLRTWRAQWARLSRAQLAIALSAQLPGRKAVTSDVLRQWEAGQPLADLDELDALCTVMGRRDPAKPDLHQYALTPLEVGHFRNSVLAACLDRHYEGLFPAIDVVPTADFPQLALTTTENWNVVSLVARMHTLEQFVASPPVQPTPRWLMLRWQEARCSLMKQLWLAHVWARRPALEIEVLSRWGRPVYERFGPGGTPETGNPLSIRHMELRARAWWGDGDAHVRAAESYLSWLLHQRDAGQDWLFALQLPQALQALGGDVPNQQLFVAFRRDIREALAWAQANEHEDVVGVWNCAVFMAALKEDRADLADRHLSRAEAITGLYPSVWPYILGIHAYAVRNLKEAQRHFERAHEMSLSTYGDWVGYCAPSMLRKVERAQHEVRHRGKGRVIATVQMERMPGP